MTREQFNQFQKKLEKLMMQFDVQEAYLVCITGDEKSVATSHIDKKLSTPQIRMIKAFTDSLLHDMINPINSSLN